MTPLAPVVLFTYKRLDTLIQTVEALQRNNLAVSSDLYIFSDAAKSENDQPEVSAVREYINTITGFHVLTIKEAVQNKGLANSIIDGVSEILEQHESVIVLEDDLICTQNFLGFMNESLTRYENKQSVFSVSGYSFNLHLNQEENYDTYFLNRGWSWGWATWKDRWLTVDWEIKDYDTFRNDVKAKRKFALGGSDLNNMLNKQMTGSLDSWAIRWFYNQFKAKGLTVYPIQSKIFNNGFDQRATHTNGSSKRYIPMMDNGKKVDFNFPLEVTLSKKAQQKFQNKMGYLARIGSKIETFLGL